MRPGALLLACVVAAPLVARAGPVARFAVVAGNNLGASGRERLWYAERDAERMERALRELGDFAPDRVAVLSGKGVLAWRAALAASESELLRARARGERTLLLVYYSGHAGLGGLELGQDRLSYDELRGAVASSQADTKVVIVDACEAGSLTRVKGARAAPGLEFALPGEDAVHGTALIASTAVGEAAQESASIGGSFFTHHLEAALRGAGDADGDGQVTLAEAFRYAASMTVSATAGTAAGPQHPTYEMRMSGRGDVVLADLRRAEARLELPPDPGATWYLRGPRGLFAEVPGRVEKTSLALPAGRYQVERRAREGRATADVTLAPGASQLLPRLTPSRYELARAKGGSLPTELSAGFGLVALGLPHFGVAPAVQVGLRREFGDLAVRFRLEDVPDHQVNDEGLSYRYGAVGGGAAALFPLVAGRVLLEAGPELGFAWATQSLPAAGSRSAGDFQAGGAAVLSAPVGPLRVGLDASVGLHVFKLDGRTAAKPGGAAALVFSYGL